VRGAGAGAEAESARSLVGGEGLTCPMTLRGVGSMPDVDIEGWETSLFVSGRKPLGGVSVTGGPGLGLYAHLDAVMTAPQPFVSAGLRADAKFTPPLYPAFPSPRRAESPNRRLTSVV
jgi:hypothetical protein